VATKRPRGDVPSEYRATGRVDPRVSALLRLARSPRPGLTMPEGSARLGSARIGSLAFPDPSLTFTRHRADLRGLPCGTCRCNDFLDRLAGPLQLSSLSRALSPRWVSPPLLGFVLFRLSVDAHTGCPLPGARGPPSVEQSHLLDPVPPSRFLTALTASSTRVSRACCIPQPTMRFAVFPSRAASLSEDSLLDAASFPRRAFTPLEEFPSPAAVPRHRGPCPPAVTSRLARRFESRFGRFSTLGRSSASRTRSSLISLAPLSRDRCASLPRHVSWLGVLGGRRSDSRGPSRAAGAARSGCLRLLRRSGLDSGSSSTSPAEAGSVSRSHARHAPPECRNVADCTLGATLVDAVGASSPAPMGLRLHVVFTCCHALSRHREREPATVVAQLSPLRSPSLSRCSSLPKQTSTPQPRTVRHPRVAGCMEPEDSLHPGQHSRAPDRGPAPTRGSAARCDRPGHHRGAAWDWARLVSPTRRPLPERRSRESTAEWPTSRPCSADESVAIPHRFQRRIALSFHGLCSPPRSSFARSSSPATSEEAVGSAAEASSSTHRSSESLRGSPGHSRRAVCGICASGVCPGWELRLSSLVTACPRARGQGLEAADLHGVCDVKDRSEERLLGRSPVTLICQGFLLTYF
jgi:hypothetical protein